MEESRPVNAPFPHGVSMCAPGVRMVAVCVWSYLDDKGEERRWHHAIEPIVAIRTLLVGAEVITEPLITWGDAQFRNPNKVNRADLIAVKGGYACQVVTCDWPALDDEDALKDILDDVHFAATDIAKEELGFKDADTVEVEKPPRYRPEGSCGHDHGDDETPGELRESAYRRGVQHGLHMAVKILEKGGTLQTVSAAIKKHAELIFLWRFRMEQFKAEDHAEVINPPWPGSPPFVRPEGKKMQPYR